MRENAVIQLEDQSKHYNNLQNILIDMAGNEYLRESQELSIVINERFESNMKNMEKLNLGIGQANFWVLNGAYMPAVLIETGFISYPNEGKLLGKESFQKTMAAALCEAILQFKEKLEAQ